MTEYCTIFDAIQDGLAVPGLEMLLTAAGAICFGLAVIVWNRVAEGAPVDQSWIDARNARAKGAAAVLIGTLMVLVGAPPRIHEYVSVRRAMASGAVRTLSGTVHDLSVKGQGQTSFGVGKTKFHVSRYDETVGLSELQGAIRDGLPVRIGFVNVGRKNIILRLEVDAGEGRCRRLAGVRGGLGERGPL